MKVKQKTFNIALHDDGIIELSRLNGDALGEFSTVSNDQAFESIGKVVVQFLLGEKRNEE